MQSDKGIGQIPVTTGLGIAIDNGAIGISLGKRRIRKGHTYRTAANGEIICP